MNKPFRAPRAREPAMGVPFPVRPVPEEIVKLYHMIDSTRAPGVSSVLQLIAAGDGQGTTTVANMLARTAASRHRQSVLLMGYGDEYETTNCLSVTEAFQAGLALKHAAAEPARDGLYWRAQLSPLAHATPDLAPAAWQDLFVALRLAFDVIFLDSPAASLAPDALGLARHCDGTIMVVQAETATLQAVQALRQDTERAGGRMIGAVLNRERRHIPNWLQRRL